MYCIVLGQIIIAIVIPPPTQSERIMPKPPLDFSDIGKHETGGGWGPTFFCLVILLKTNINKPIHIAYY